MARDEDPVGTFGAHGADESFDIAVHCWRLRRAHHDLHANRVEHRVECGGELRVPIPDQVGDTTPGLFGLVGEVAGQLGRPRAGRVGSDAGRVHPA